MRSFRAWMRSSRMWVRSSRGCQVWMRSSREWMRSSRVWMWPAEFESDLSERGWDLAECGWDLAEGVKCGWDLAECALQTRSDLCICSKIDGMIVGIYKSLTDTWIWKLGTKTRSFIIGNICFEISVQCVCSVDEIKPEWLDSTGFDPSILWHSGIWGAADEAVLNNKHKNQKYQILPLWKSHTVTKTADGVVSLQSELEKTYRDA